MSYFCTESDDPDHSLAESDSSISILSNVDNHKDFDVYSVYIYIFRYVLHFYIHREHSEQPQTSCSILWEPIEYLYNNMKARRRTQEFLRYLLDAIHVMCLQTIPKGNLPVSPSCLFIKIFVYSLMYLFNYLLSLFRCLKFAGSA